MLHDRSLNTGVQINHSCALACTATCICPADAHPAQVRGSGPFWVWRAPISEVWALWPVGFGK